MVISRKKKETVAIPGEDPVIPLESYEIPKSIIDGVSKMGSELLDEAAAEPTLDRYLDRSPKLGNPIDYLSLVANLQWKRKTYITAEQKKKEPKSDE